MRVPATAVSQTVINANIASPWKKEEEKCNTLFSQPRQNFGKTGLPRAYNIFSYEGYERHRRVKIITPFILAFSLLLKKRHTEKKIERRIVGKRVPSEDFKHHFYCFHKSLIQFTALFSLLRSKT